MISKKLLSGYYIMLIVAVILIVLSFLTPGGNVYNAYESDKVTELFPAETEYISDDHRVFTIELDQSKPLNNCLYLISLHQNVKVYSEDEMIYSIELEPYFMSRTAGLQRNYVDFMPGTKELTVEMESFFKSSNDSAVRFYQGNAYDITRDIFANSFVETLICILDIFVGVLLMIYWLIFRKQSSLDITPFYLGIVAVIIGMWSFNETDISGLLISNRSAASNMAFLLLLCLAPSVILFTKKYNNIKGNIVSSIICIYSFVLALMLAILHISGVFAIKEAAMLVHSLLIICIIYFIYALVMNIRHNGLTKKSKLNMLASIILVSSTGIDIYLYYTSLLQVKFTGRMGILFYICIIGYETIIDSMQQIEEGRKAKIYRKWAITDAMTQLKNRTAYSEWENKNQKQNGTIIINLDLNKLKYHNDEFGHAIGDEYIISAAKIIDLAFSEIGTSYRIGGDEFCVVVENADEAQVENCINRLIELQNEYNESSDIIDMQIAYGYAEYDPSLDKNMEETRSRADARMYTTKSQMKAN